MEIEFGARGWKQLPDAISRKYHFVPAKVEVEEHHIGVYASKTDEHMVKADHPKALLHGSLVSPSLGAAIINGKYLKTITVSKKDKFGDAVGYALNQEKYLRVFLTDGDVPINNNASERAIRGFCIGKKNWQMIDTIHGAKSSAIIYSIVETAKANNLKPFDYVEYLLEEIPKHMDDRDCSFLEDLLPWSEKLPAGIRKA